MEYQKGTSSTRSRHANPYPVRGARVRHCRGRGDSAVLFSGRVPCLGTRSGHPRAGRWPRSGQVSAGEDFDDDLRIERNRGRGFHVPANRIRGRRGHQQWTSGGREAHQMRSPRKNEDPVGRGTARHRLEPEGCHYFQNEKFSRDERSIWRGTPRAGDAERDGIFGDEERDLRSDRERRRGIIPEANDEEPRRIVQYDREWDSNCSIGEGDKQHIIADRDWILSHHDELHSECEPEMDLRQKIKGPEIQGDTPHHSVVYDEHGLRTDRRHRIGDPESRRDSSHHDTHRHEMDRRHRIIDPQSRRDAPHHNSAHYERRPERDWRPRIRDSEIPRDILHDDDYALEFDLRHQMRNPEKSIDLRNMLARSERDLRRKIDSSTRPHAEWTAREDSRHHSRERDPSHTQRSWARSHEHRDSADRRFESRRDVHRESRAAEEEGGSSGNPHSHRAGEWGGQRHGFTQGSPWSRQGRAGQRRGHPQPPPERSREREHLGSRDPSSRQERTQTNKTEDPRSHQQKIPSPADEHKQEDDFEDFDELEMEYMFQSPTTSNSSHEEDGELKTEVERGVIKMDTSEEAASRDDIEMAFAQCTDAGTSSEWRTPGAEAMECSPSKQGQSGRREMPRKEAQDSTKSSPGETFLPGAFERRTKPEASKQSPGKPQGAQNESSGTSEPSHNKTDVSPGIGNKGDTSTSNDGAMMTEHVTPESPLEPVADYEQAHDDMDLSREENDSAHAEVRPESDDHATVVSDRFSMDPKGIEEVMPESSGKKSSHHHDASDTADVVSSPKPGEAASVASWQENLQRGDGNLLPRRAAGAVQPNKGGPQAVVQQGLTRGADAGRHTAPPPPQSGLTGDDSQRRDCADSSRKLRPSGEGGEGAEAARAPIPKEGLPATSAEQQHLSPGGESADASCGCGERRAEGKATQAPAPRARADEREHHDDGELPRRNEFEIRGSCVSSSNSAAAAAAAATSQLACPENVKLHECESAITRGSLTEDTEFSAPRKQSADLTSPQPTDLAHSAPTQTLQRESDDGRCEVGQLPSPLRGTGRAVSAVKSSQALNRCTPDTESIEFSSHGTSAGSRREFAAATKTERVTPVSGDSVEDRRSTAPEDSGSPLLDAGLQLSGTLAPTQADRRASSAAASGNGDNGDIEGGSDSDVEMLELYSSAEEGGGDKDEQLMDSATARAWAVTRGSRSLPLQPRALNNPPPRQQKPRQKARNRSPLSRVPHRKTSSADTSAGSVDSQSDSPSLVETAAQDLTTKLSGLVVGESSPGNSTNDKTPSDNSSNYAIMPSNSGSDVNAMENQNSSFGHGTNSGKGLSEKSPKFRQGQGQISDGSDLKTNRSDMQSVRDEDTASLAESKFVSHSKVSGDGGGSGPDSGEKPLLRITLKRHPVKEGRQPATAASSAPMSSPEQRTRVTLAGRNSTEYVASKTCQTSQQCPASHEGKMSAPASEVVSPAEDASVSGMLQRLTLPSGEGKGHEVQNFPRGSSSAAWTQGSSGDLLHEALDLKLSEGWVVMDRVPGTQPTISAQVASTSCAEIKHQSSVASHRALSADVRSVPHRPSLENLDQYVPVLPESPSGVNITRPLIEGSRDRDATALLKINSGNLRYIQDTQGSTNLYSSADPDDLEGINRESIQQRTSTSGGVGVIENETAKSKLKSSAGLFEELEPPDKHAVYPNFRVQLKKKGTSKMEPAPGETKSSSADSYTETAEVPLAASRSSTSNNLELVPMDIDDDSDTSGRIECVNDPSTPVQTFYSTSLAFPSFSQQGPSFPPFPPVPAHGFPYPPPPLPPLVPYPPPPGLLSQPPPPVPSYVPWMPASEVPIFTAVTHAPPLERPLPEEPPPPLPPLPPPTTRTSQPVGSVQLLSTDSVISESLKIAKGQHGESAIVEEKSPDHRGSQLISKSRPIPTVCETRSNVLKAAVGMHDSRGLNLIDLTPSHRKFMSTSPVKAQEPPPSRQKSSDHDEQPSETDDSFLPAGNNVHGQVRSNYDDMNSYQNSPGELFSHQNKGNNPECPEKVSSQVGPETSWQDLRSVQPWSGVSESADPVEIHPCFSKVGSAHPQILVSAGHHEESPGLRITRFDNKISRRASGRKSRWSDVDHKCDVSNPPSAVVGVHERSTTVSKDLNFRGHEASPAHSGKSSRVPVMSGSQSSYQEQYGIDSVGSQHGPPCKDVEQRESKSALKHESGAEDASSKENDFCMIVRESGSGCEGGELLPASDFEPKASKELLVDQRPFTDRVLDNSSQLGGKKTVESAASQDTPVVTDLGCSPTEDSSLLNLAHPSERNESLMNDEITMLSENSPDDSTQMDLAPQGGDGETWPTFEGESSHTESSHDAWEDKTPKKVGFGSFHGSEPEQSSQSLLSDVACESTSDAPMESAGGETTFKDPSASRAADSRSLKSSSGEKHRHDQQRVRRKSSADKDKSRKLSLTGFKSTSRVYSQVARSTSWGSESLSSYFESKSPSSLSNSLKGFKIPKKKSLEDSAEESGTSPLQNRKAVVRKTSQPGSTSEYVVDSASGSAVETGPRQLSPLVRAGSPSRRCSQESSSDLEPNSPLSAGRRGSSNSQAGSSKGESPPSPLQPPSKPHRNRIYDSDSDSDLEDVEFLVQPSTSEQNSSVSKRDDWDHFRSPLSQPQTLGSSILDSLVAEIRREATVEREHQERRRLLKEEIENKGKGKVVEEESHKELELNEDQIKTLNALKMPETVIQDVHPGEKVFHSSRRQCLFTSSLALQDCGFSPGSGELDSYLCSCQDETKSLIMSELLIVCSEKFSDFDTILDWLFLIMSVQEDALVVEACQQTMAGHMQGLLGELQQQQQSGGGGRQVRFWAPPLHVVVRAFLNMGTQLEDIIPDQSLLSSDQLREATRRTVNENAAPAPAAARGGEEEEERQLPMENLQAVLEALNLVLQARPRYSEKELSALFLMVAKVSLDQGLRDSYLEYELSSCLESILEAFTEDSLNRAVPSLCRQLCQMVEHHHNRVYVCSLLPKGGACCRMRQGFAFLALHQMLGLPEPSPQTLQNVEVQDCLPLVSHLGQLLQQLYVLHSAVQLLDCSVGSKAAFRPDSGLQQLNRSLQPLRGRIRETGGNLDASKVKNAMVKLNSKWTLLLNAYSHTKPFESPGPMESLETDELEDSSPERKTSETAEETLVETGYENEDCPYIVDSDEDMLPDI